MTLTWADRLACRVRGSRAAREGAAPVLASSVDCPTWFVVVGRPLRFCSLSLRLATRKPEYANRFKMVVKDVSPPELEILPGYVGAAQHLATPARVGRVG